MQIAKVFTGVAMAALMATSATAGGLAPTPQPPVVVVPVQPPPPQPSSWGVILPILGVALLIGLATSSSDSDDEETFE